MKIPKRFLSVVIKLFIFVAAILFACFKLNQAKELQTFWIKFPELFVANWHLLITILLLIGINWGIEAFKWKFVLRSYFPISYILAIKSVMSGVTLGLFTPNRIGEFGGRVLYLPKNKRLKASVLSIISSYSQFFVTLFLGIPAVLVFLSHYSFSSVISNTLLVLSFCIAGLLMWLYFNIKTVITILKRVKILNRYVGRVSELADVNRMDLFKLLLLSMIRYSVFVFQFFLILRFFLVDMAICNVIVSVASLYFLMSLLPMFTIGEPGLRASLTIVLFQPYVISITNVVAASLMLWLINVLLIGLLGAIFMLSLKFFSDDNIQKL